MIATKRFAACDEPTCAVVVDLADINDYPDGWRKVDSTDHLSSPKRKHSEDYYLGSIRLDLCPEHAGAFDAHLPQTIGYSGRLGRDGYATVSCSCGTALGRASACYLLNGPEGVPGHEPERAWWRHLPVDLKSYYAKRAGVGA